MCFSGREKPQRDPQRSRANAIEAEATEMEPPSEDLVNTLHHVASRAPQPYRVTIQVNDKSVEMEIDTGAAVSIISGVLAVTVSHF